MAFAMPLVSMAVSVGVYDVNVTNGDPVEVLMVALLGHKIVGGIVSRATTLKVHEPMFPTPSVEVQVTAVVP